jgi:hypothetical protein
MHSQFQRIRFISLCSYLHGISTCVNHDLSKVMSAQNHINHGSTLHMAYASLWNKKKKVRLSFVPNTLMLAIIRKPVYQVV